MPHNREVRVTWKDWCVGATSDGTKTVAHPFRVINRKHYPGELYGKEFKTSDEAFAAMDGRGYSQVYYARSSVVEGAFKGLACQERQAKFDALYRLWKWRKRNGLCAECTAGLEKELAKLAEQVGIFHPCTKRFRKVTLPLKGRTKKVA
jgi:hypothetical protein